jgi:hypothetical protein
MRAMTTGLATVRRRAVGGVGDEATPAVAEAVLELIVAAVPRLREKFARPEKVDKDVLQHFVLGMDEAPESSEKEKGEDPARPSRASEASAKSGTGSTSSEPARAAAHQIPNANNRRQQPTLVRGANNLLLLCERKGREQRASAPTTDANNCERSGEAGERANDRRPPTTSF